MALEEFVLVLLDDRRAGARIALPMHALQRIARPILAQADELFRVADRCSERHAALLEAALAGKRDGRQPIALRQRDHATRCGDPGEAANKAERLGARKLHGVELEASAPLRAQPEGDRAVLAGRNIFQGFARGALGRVPLDQPAPAKVSLVAIEPVALFFARLP